MRPKQPIDLIAHSYGSFTAGQALLQGAEVRNVVFLGSPGVGVDNVDEFPPGAAEHFYVAEIDGDIVATFEHFGDAPTDPDFGATLVDMGDSDSYNPITRHGGYFGDQGVSTLADILEGREPPRDDPTLLEDILEGAEDGLDLVDGAIDLGQELPLLGGLTGPWADPFIDFAQEANDHAESAAFAVVETGVNIGLDVAEDVGGALVDGVTGLGDSLIHFGIRH